MIRHALAPSTPALSIQRKTLYLAVAATLSLPGSVVAADVALPRIDVVGAVVLDERPQVVGPAVREHIGPDLGAAAAPQCD